jgi:deaminated glutathione amidase
MRRFGVAGLQFDCKGSDNLAHIASEVAASKRRMPWVDMFVLPELCVHGPGLKHAQAVGGPSEQALRDIARDNAVWLIPGSLFQSQAGEVFNTAPVIDPAGTVVCRCRKLFPFLPYEEGVTAGDSFCTFAIEGIGHFGVSICYDLWFPEVTRSLAWLGAEVLICPSLTNTIDRDVELCMARAAAAGNQCYVVNVNAGAPLGMGRSIVCGPGGEVIHQAGSAHEMFAVELDFDYLARVRRHGWQGLGQPLKSFRDSRLRFPAYDQDAASPSLQALGPLHKPQSLRADST